MMLNINLNAQLPVGHICPNNTCSILGNTWSREVNHPRYTINIPLTIELCSPIVTEWNQHCSMTDDATSNFRGDTNALVDYRMYDIPGFRVCKHNSFSPPCCSQPTPGLCKMWSFLSSRTSTDMLQSDIHHSGRFVLYSSLLTTSEHDHYCGAWVIVFLMMSKI